MTRIFHTSDLHFGAEDPAALDWFAETVRTEKPDAAIVTGDLTQRARRSEFRAAAQYLAALPVPVSVEPGNHDLPYFNLFERFVRPYRRVERAAKMVEAEIDLADCVVVPLKTTARFQLRLNWSHGNVSSRGLARSLRLAQAVPDDKMVIIACHHPLVDIAETGTKGRTRGGEEALRRLSACGAQAVITGHVHTPFDVTHRLDGGGSIRLIGAGTLSERIREHVPSFNDIEIVNGDLSVRHRVA
ncbi:metallophosphoesterase family protein [Pacificimonas flava]|uniref:Metallophosphoesterase n=1 Tax=Pacificimonas flava TaxID=1234595 RepID=M2U970_9SPHN|nr:metallophosphoesterase [Pacificimonas flava]EMD84538.1 metallophosphoesterase [Pacificimonas flava]MBB5279590.1 3',5'-cyclic AMP phosphodiesterase CpdA [Pacificimonas flava]